MAWDGMGCHGRERQQEGVDENGLDGMGYDERDGMACYGIGWEETSRMGSGIIKARDRTGQGGIGQCMPWQ